MRKWNFFNIKTGHFYFGLTSQKQGGDLSLGEAYSFDRRLQVLHPDNKHIRPKICQQLQILRDKGILEFKGQGKYQFK
ncbi:MAG: hypothetical protein AB1325_04250 [Nitrospirota bacterium]